MAVKIIHKNSAVEDKRPTAAQLENGELGLNYNAAGAFLTCRDTEGNIQQVGGVKISDNAPDSPPIQCLWFKPADLTLFVFDGDNWLPIAGGGGGGGGGTGDISTIIGNDGIDANEVAGVVTLDVDLDGNNCGLKFNSSRLSAEIASETKLGSVKIGDGIDVAADGTISVDNSELDLTLCVDGGLAYDPNDECYSVDWSTFPGGDHLSWDGDFWSVEQSLNDLTDVDLKTTPPVENDILIWDGTNWVPEQLTDVQLDWSDLAACDNGGLVWDDTDECWSVDWQELPTGDTIDWDGDKWDVDWEQLPTDNSLDWDGVNEQWGVDWEQFPGGKFLDYNNRTEAWDVTSIVSQDTAPDYEEDKLWFETDSGNLYVGYDDYWIRINTPGKDGDPVVISQDTAPPFQEDAIWFDTSTGEAFFGYVDPSGDEYWVALTKPGAPGKDGDPVVISQDTAPPFQEDAIWFDTSTGEAFFGYKDPSDDEYWVSLSKPGAPGADGDPVIISQDTAPPFQEDAIWFNTSTGEAFFGYKDPSGDEYWVALSKPGADGAPVVISQDIAPPFQEDAIWFNTSTGEAFFGYKDPSGDEYWVSLSKPGADGAPVVISQDIAPPFQEDAIWFNTSTGEAFFGYRDPSGDEYWVSLSKPGADGDPVIISQDIAPTFQEDAIWFNTNTAEAFFGYRDPSGDEYWVALTKPGAPGADGVTVIVGDTAPVNPVDGQIWHNSDNGVAYAYWSSQGVWVSM